MDEQGGELTRLAGRLTSLRAIAAFVTAVAIGSSGVTAWAITKIDAKADAAPMTARINGQQEQINTIVAKLAANDEAHRAMNAEMVEVHTDTRETRRMLWEMYQGGKRSGMWGTADIPAPSALSARGAP